MSAALLAAAPIGTFALFLVAVAVGGVVHVSVPLVGALFVAYMVASGILLLHGDEWVLAISLVPTLTAAVVAVGASGWHAAGAVAITAQVVAVLPSGNLVVEAQRKIFMNNQHEDVTVRGVLRPQDIGSDNTVPSAALSNLEIEMKGKGIIADSVRSPNKIMRALLWLVGF